MVLLSESCLPLYPPTLMYAQLISEPKSRINGCHDWVHAPSFLMLGPQSQNCMAGSLHSAVDGHEHTPCVLLHESCCICLRIRHVLTALQGCIAVHSAQITCACPILQVLP